MAKENAGKVAVTFLHIAQRSGWKETRCGGQALPTVIPPSLYLYSAGFRSKAWLVLTVYFPLNKTNKVLPSGGLVLFLGQHFIL